MIKSAVQRYKAPTPLKYKVWGKVILGLGTVMQVSLQNTPGVPVWVTITIALLTAVGTVLPEFAVIPEYSEESNNKSEDKV